MQSLALIDHDDDLFWEDLLIYIEERKVVPIIGEQLLRVVDDHGEVVLLQHLLALQLAERLRLPVQDLPDHPDLHQVVTLFLQRRGRREQIYPRLKKLMDEITLIPWRPLQQLAEIEAFPLYITLGFDNLMEHALQQARQLDTGQWQSYSYTPHTPQDLPQPLAELTGPIVYHVLGRVSAAPDYVLSEEDWLEFLYALPSEERRPPHLFDALRDYHLLLLGGQQSRWMLQFLLRIIKGRPLSHQRPEMEVVVDLHAARNDQLIGFFEHYSYSTRIIGQDLAEFVDRLYQHWRERHPQQEQREEAATVTVHSLSPQANHALNIDMTPGCVFISYASEDRHAAKRLHDALDRSGIDTWFDQGGGLEAGDDYALKIRRNINRSALFIPLISNHAVQRLEGFFRREWRWAAERAEAIADGIPFIIPVVIDDTQAYNEQLPEAMTRQHWSRLLDGEADNAFIERMVQLVRNYRRQLR